VPPNAKAACSEPGEGHTEGTGDKKSSGTHQPVPPFPKPSGGPSIWPKGNGSKGSPEPAAPKSTADDYISDLMSVLGCRRISGTVIAVEPPYIAKPETNWASMLLKLTLGIILFPFLIALPLAAAIFSIFFGDGGKPGFLSNISSQVVGFFLTGKLFGPKDHVPVRDIRLRDASGQEHLVRIRGELVAGNMSVGDEVEVEGYSRRGTLMFRRGRNKRTRSEIMIKYR